jgi:hypothetical protein
MNENDRRIIEIFNEYKKTQNIFRKRRVNALYKKRLAKKTFFKIKRVDATAILRTNSNGTTEKRELAAVINEQTNSPKNPEIEPGKNKCILKDLSEIYKMNIIFFKNFMDFDYEYGKTINLFQSFVNHSIKSFKILENTQPN